MNSYNSTHGSEAMSVEEVAMGFINVTNETMCRPIRAMTQVCFVVLTVVLFSNNVRSLYAVFKYLFVTNQ